MVDRLVEMGQRYFEIQGDNLVDLNKAFPIETRGSDRFFWSWRNAAIGAVGGFLTVVGLGWSLEPISQVAAWTLVSATLGGITRSWPVHSFRERMFPSSNGKLLSPPNSQLATYWMK